MLTHTRLVSSSHSSSSYFFIQPIVVIAAIQCGVDWTPDLTTTVVVVVVVVVVVGPRDLLPTGRLAAKLLQCLHGVEGRQWLLPRHPTAAVAFRRLVKARRGIGGHEGVDSVDVSVPVLVTSRGTITIIIALIVVIAEVVAAIVVAVVTIVIDGVTITSCLVRFEVI